MSSKSFFHSTLIVAIPCFNESSYIATAISSLKSQTYANFICIIRDNCSGDNTVSRALNEIDRDPRFFVQVAPFNEGASRNWWNLYKNSQSPYFLFLGAHDFLHPTYIEELISVLDADSSVSMCFSRVQKVDDKGSLAGSSSGGDFVFDISSNILRYCLATLFMGPECTAIHGVFRRSALQNLQDFPSYLGCDRYVLSVLQFKGKFKRVEKPLYYRRYFSHRETSQIERITGSRGSSELSSGILPLVWSQAIYPAKARGVLGSALVLPLFLLLIIKYRSYFRLHCRVK